jgi:hypothetical protein
MNCGAGIDPVPAPFFLVHARAEQFVVRFSFRKSADSPFARPRFEAASKECV